ncbi:putative prophage protein, partial [Streptococcus pneumoniae]
MAVHNILTWPMPITQQVVDSVKQTLTKPLLECTLTLI